MMTKSCERCGATFSRNPQYSDRQWQKSRFCSRRCIGFGTLNESPLARLFGHVSMDNSSRCWEWTGARDTKGYGLICVDGRANLKAHRVAYELAVGDIPAGMLVLHRCDNPRCVNPFHLFLGTTKDNAEDMVMKGRNSPLRGSSSPTARLTEAEVIAIRADSRTQDQIARAYGIAQTTVSAIKTKRIWSHV